MNSWVALNATSKRTRVVMTMGEAVVLRANLPPLSAVRNARAVTMLLEALALWADERLCVALHAGDEENCFRCDLTDEMGLGARSVYFAVELVKHEPRRRGRRSADAGRPRQLALVTSVDGAR